ncbi:MAG: hypothetical protein OEU26_09140 [Candidatus Tectomicrobia bacterium]|nr:hypothetical protein [Candidatus Tectomicrobia bacterium]
MRNSKHADATLVLVDGHVHIYACHEIDRVLDSAWRHFKRVADGYGTADFQGVLIFTESAGDQVFDDLFHCTRRTVGRWYVLETGEKRSLSLQRGDGARLLLLAGRQLVSREKLELSAYFITETVADGAPLTTLLEQVHGLGGLSVLPWGVGKWFGKRGREVAERLGRSATPLLLSDNGGRPWFWPMPRLFHLARQQHIPVLAGSDPLPKVSEQQQAGRVGFVLKGALRPEYPAEDLKQRLLALQAPPPRYGKPEGAWGFVRNQIYMQARRAL